MRRALLPTLPLCTLFVLACGGGPTRGESCENEGFLCADENTAFECREGESGSRTWFELPCRGPNGCTAQGGQITCDVTANQIGDDCASTMENRGICAQDGRSALVCRDGEFVKASDCQTCTVTAEEVVCQP